MAAVCRQGSFVDKWSQAVQGGQAEPGIGPPKLWTNRRNGALCIVSEGWYTQECGKLLGERENQPVDKLQSAATRYVAIPIPYCGCWTTALSRNVEVKSKIQTITHRFSLTKQGAGESGKSTVIKQLKSIHKVEMDEQELNNYRVTIHNNTLSMMQVFIEAAEKYNFEFTDEEKVSLKKDRTNLCPCRCW